MDFSLIIPTYNRAGILAKTLDALACQQVGSEDRNLEFEVIVVDDGSEDQTAECVRRRQPGFPVRLLYLVQANQKQGAARNYGVRQAHGELVVFLGDDTVPVPHFLLEHWKSHQDGNPRKAVIGYTRWPQELRTTAFMRYIGEEGWQFGYSLIRDPENLPFNFFYTSNISLRRQFFVESGGFDVAFQEYGWEDVELSLRLQKMGMQLTYNPAAVAFHHHPTTLREFAQRQRKVGFSAWTLYARHPQMARFLNIDKARPYTTLERLRFELMALVCSVAEHWDWLDLTHLYPHLMSYYYNCGLLEADRLSPP